jgi:hypothetical protein
MLALALALALSVALIARGSNAVKAKAHLSGAERPAV